MRSLRAFLFLCVGLFLGGFSVFAFAAASDYGRSMRLNAPESSRARFTGIPRYDFDSAPSAWGKMKDINSIGIGNKVFDVTGGRLFSPQTLARGAVSFVRFGGPAWIGFMLAGLVWDEVSKTWLTPGEQVAPDGWGWYFEDGNPLNRHPTPEGVCEELAKQRYGDVGVWFVDPGTGGNFICRHKDIYQASYKQKLIRTEAPGTCEAPYEWNAATRFCESEQAPAQDQQIEDAIYAELVSRGMGSDLARRLIEAGYNPPVEGIEIDGPASIPGDSVTSTTSGPAGTTSTTTNTTHNISYTTNTTNNTSTVTITNVSTTAVTAPDGTTTTETTESAPEGQTEPPPEEKPFCELYPDASACAKLDVPAGDPNESEDVTVTLTPTGGFGSEGGSCPPPFPFVVQGRSYQISYAQACDFFSAVRPVVIAAAMLSALLIALGGYKRD